MKDDLGARFVKCTGERSKVAHIAAHIPYFFQYTEAVQCLTPALGRCIERESRHLRPCTQEQECEPHPLKARMPCEEDALSLVKTQIVHRVRRPFQIF